MVAIRLLVVVLAVYEAVIVPFPVPDAGETVHQATLLEAVQAQEPVTVKVVVPAAEETG